MAAEVLTTISPTTNKGVLTRNGATAAELDQIVKTSAETFKTWSKTTLAERKQIVGKAMKNLESKQEEYALQLTEQMGRPIGYTAKEIVTAVKKGEYLVKISDEALADTPGAPEEGFNRYIRKAPVGPVLILSPWNVSLLPPARFQRESQLTLMPVSLPRPHQRAGPRHPFRQHRGPQAVPSDSLHCREPGDCPG